MLIDRRRLLALLVVLPAAIVAKDYENLKLPTAPTISHLPVLNVAKLSYTTNKVKLKGSNLRLNEPSVDHKEYIFVKEAFIAEKRDQALKLLRQELDSGIRQNRENMLLRLGQLYAEKYMELAYLENEVYTQALTDFEKTKAANPNAKPPAQDDHRSKTYLKDALTVFYDLEREYPKHPKIDEVLFFIGFVEMEAGNGVKGANYLERVIRNHPRSRKFEEAVIYLGDHYFEKQKYAFANGKYRILLSRPSSSLFHYAKYKIAWCDLNLGQPRKGLQDMKQLVKELAGTQDKAKFNLREQAIRDLVIFFAEAEAVEEATQFYTDTLGRDKALENLRLIADILRSKGKDLAAVKAYQRLLDEFPNSLDAPLLYLGVYDSLIRLGKTEAAIATLEKALKLYGSESEWAKNYPKEKEKDKLAALNQLQTESEKAALFQHQSAQKSQNKVAYSYALRLYTAILASFPNHPSRKSIAFYRGDLLYNQGKYLDAADSYMFAAKVPPKDKQTDEAVYLALQALDKLTQKAETLTRYTKDQQKNVSTTPEEIPVGEKRFIEVADFYVTEYPQGQRVVDVKFRVASIYFRYHHFDEALKRFQEIALKHPKHKGATTAANIVLDIHNIKKDYDALNQSAILFAGTEGLGDAKFRADMAQIVSEVGFKSIEKLEADNKWNEAGDAYIAVYKSNPNGPLAEKALYNAYISYSKAGELAKSKDASNAFIAKFPKSEYTARLTLGSAKAAESAYDYDQAQRLYANFHTKFPKDKESRKALYNAAALAELLEHNREAMTLYTEYLKGPTSAEEKKQIQVSQAKLHRKLGEYDKMGLAYRRLARDAGSMGEKLTLLGELARQYEVAGKNAEKEQTLKEMRYLYASAKGAKVEGKGIEYIAEGEFRAVAKQRDKYNEVQPRFPPQDLVYLLKRKQNLLKKLSDSYDQVVAVGVPEWGVAALYEKSAAFDDYVRGFRAVKIPGNFKGDDRTAAEAALKDIDDKQIKPLEARAIEIAQACYDRAVQFKVASEYATRCRNRLKKTDGDLVEPSGLYPSPSYFSTRPPGGDEVAKK